MPIAGNWSRSVPATSAPSCVNVGGMRTSTTATSGRCSATASTSEPPSPTRAHTSTPASASSLANPSAPEHRVVGDHDPHGTTASTRVPTRGVGDDGELSTCRFDAVREAPQTRSARIGTTAPVVLDDEAQLAAEIIEANSDARGRGVLRGVGDRLTRDEPQRGFDERGVALPGIAHGDGHRQPRRQVLQRSREATVFEHGGMQTVGQGPQLGDRVARFANAELERGPEPLGIPVEQRGLHLRRGAEQPLLSPVVQIAFDPPALVDLSLGDPLARCPHLFELHRHGSPESRVVELGGGLVEHCSRRREVIACRRHRGDGPAASVDDECVGAGLRGVPIFGHPPCALCIPVRDPQRRVSERLSKDGLDLGVGSRIGDEGAHLTERVVAPSLKAPIERIAHRDVHGPSGGDGDECRHRDRGR